MSATSTPLAPAPRAPVHADSPQQSPALVFGLRELDLVLIVTALIALWNSVHDTRMTLPMLAVCGLAVWPRTRTNPMVWLVAAASWIPVLVFNWSHMEDHVYLATYWLLAVGLTLTARHHSDVSALLRHHARHLVGLTFAAATAWKATSGAFWSGRVFQQVLNFDHRFEWPFATFLGGADTAALESNRSAADAFRQAGATLEPVALAPGTSLTGLAMVIVVGTIIVEAAIALTFLAPDSHKLAKARHLSLLAFCWTTYPFVPVLGFALLLCTLGAVVAQPGSRYKAVYVISALCFMACLVLPF